MNKFGILAATALMAAAAPGLAQAASAYSTANVNLRAGPSTSYPAVVVIPAGSGLQVHGCLESPNWCDVSYGGGRGWVAGTYIQMTYSSKRVYVKPDYYQRLGVPVITFNVGTYWDDHYKKRDFYDQRNKWEKRDGGHDAPKPAPVADQQPKRAEPKPQRDQGHNDAPSKPEMKRDMPAANAPDRQPKPDMQRDQKGPANQQDSRPAKQDAPRDMKQGGKPNNGNDDKGHGKKPACQPGQQGNCQPG